MKKKAVRGIFTAVTLCTMVAAQTNIVYAAAAKSEVSTTTKSETTSTKATKKKTTAKFTASQEDATAVRASLTKLQEFIRSEDAKGVASMFTEDGDYIDEDEARSKGHAEIEATFASVFKDVGRPKIAFSIDNVIFLSRDVVMIEGTSKQQSDNSVLSKFTILEVKEGKTWKLSRASEHGVAPVVASQLNQNLDDIAWMVGDWKAEREGVSVQLNARWTQNRNFIVCKYLVNRPDSEQTIDIQVIAWDPRIAQPVSWSFDSNGSFTSGRWFKQGRDWSVDTSGVERDGSATRSTNVLSNISTDSFNWFSVNRCMNGLPMADTAPLLVQRLAAAPADAEGGKQ